jgi:hypothetical protein
MSLDREAIKKIVDQLNEGSISYADLPEPFQIKKDKIRIPIKPVNRPLTNAAAPDAGPVFLTFMTTS